MLYPWQCFLAANSVANLEFNAFQRNKSLSRQFRRVSFLGIWCRHNRLQSAYILTSLACQACQPYLLGCNDPARLSRIFQVCLHVAAGLNSHKLIPTAWLIARPHTRHIHALLGFPASVRATRQILERYVCHFIVRSQCLLIQVPHCPSPTLILTLCSMSIFESPLLARLRSPCQK